MRRSISKWPIATFNLPPHPPDAVKDAYEKFDRLGHEFGRLRGELHDAEQEVRGARAKDVRRIADAAAAGKTVADQSKHEHEAHAKVHTLERTIEGTALALDEAGNALAKAIVHDRTKWLADLAEAEREASGRYIAALEAAKAAIVDLRPARGAVQWLERFEYGPATAGEHAGFAGGQVFVDTRTLARDLRTPVADVVELLATLEVNAREKPQPNRRAAA